MLTMIFYTMVMSKFDPMIKSADTYSRFDDSFARLQAVDAVVVLIADMAKKHGYSLNLPQRETLEAAYAKALHLPQKRFDAICDELAVMARSGAQALLQLKSAGRNNLGVAAQRLLLEIDKKSAELLRIVRH